jgi:hypothetical protein
MNPPVVSVVMSVFNGQVYLSEAIESILGQTFGDFEFVIVDDGSKDGTAEILAGYAGRDRRVRVVRHENKGRAASLNVGISMASGRYIARMDADDVAMPSRLQEQVDFLGLHPEVGLLGGTVEMVNAAGRVVHTARPPLEDEEIRSVMLRYNPMFHPAVVMRKEVVVASGGYRTAFTESEDYDLWLRMSERSRLANLDKLLLRYRIHSSQASIRNLEHQTRCVLAARAAAMQRKRGMPDPLTGVEEITPQLLEKLGVKTAETQEALLGAYEYWTEILGLIDAEEALRVIEGMLRLPEAENFPRSTLANAWLKAAGIHYRQGRVGKALSAGWHAILVRPMVAGRPVKRAFTRLTGAGSKDNVYGGWEDREFAAPSPPFIKQKVLLRNGLRDATWVETGTYMGETTSVLSKVAKMVYSIEPEPTLFSKAEQRFSNTSNVKIIKGLSEEVLPKLLPTIRGNICFWLDGHYSEGITFRGPRDTPVLDELTAIGENIPKTGKIVVMVDDVRCFDPRNPEFTAYPPVDVLVDWARKHNLAWHIEHDIFIAKNH